MFLMTKLEFIGSVPLIVSHSGFRVNMLHCPPPYLLLILVFVFFHHFTENICDAKHGWCVATHNALCHGYAFKCQLVYCDKWCLEGSRTRIWCLWHVKARCSRCSMTSFLSPCPRPVSEITAPAVGLVGSLVFLPVLQSCCRTAPWRLCFKTIWNLLISGY